ncbi:MAG: hypothetical protein KDA84_25775, partial [Planctomycetaceae bacterium]|nr:hypothetical protein [Planctomycetaceae bacterium]
QPRTVLMTLFNLNASKLRWLVHYEGWWFALFRLAVKASAYLGTQGTQSDWFQRLAERRFDRRFQVSTAGMITPQELQLTPDQQAHAVEYWPTSNFRLGQILSQLGIDHAKFTFIDLGSGKGRVLLMASEYPFQRAIGVELSDKLHTVALQNILAFRGDRQCPNVESVCCDATRFRFPHDPLVLYLFNPFSQTILTKVVQNLLISLDANPRPVIVIYFNALHAAVFEAYDGFRECGANFSLPEDWKVFWFDPPANSSQPAHFDM